MGALADEPPPVVVVALPPVFALVLVPGVPPVCPEAVLVLVPLAPPVPVVPTGVVPVLDPRSAPEHPTATNARVRQETTLNDFETIP